MRSELELALDGPWVGSRASGSDVLEPGSGKWLVSLRHGGAVEVDAACDEAQWLCCKNREA
ncbi:hypothetical protein SPH9361_04968 [Sphingobium sp. CECT 9361]|nr:hypothetical protein SPH9361_04968 [Sphingobium sp. CECT 9361]